MRKEQWPTAGVVRGRLYLAKDHVLGVKPVACIARDEELAAVRVRTGVGHGKQARPGVLQIEVLVVELVPVDRDASRAITFDEIAALAHEALDNPMECAPLEANRFARLAAVRRPNASVSASK